MSKMRSIPPSDPPAGQPATAPGEELLGGNDINLAMSAIVRATCDTNEGVQRCLGECAPKGSKPFGKCGTKILQK